MKQEGGAQAVERLIRTYGCLPATVDGPIVLKFAPTALAKAIEQEVKRAGAYGWDKITMHMDLIDAVQLAKFLRNR